MSEWKEYAFGDVAELLYGKGLKESERRPGNTPVYGSNGIIGFHNESLVKGPGVIIGRKGSVGEIRYSESDFYPIDTTYYLDLKSGNDIKFFYYNLLTLQLNDMNSHSAVPGLNRNDVYSLKIPVPTIPEQRAIASVLSSLDDKIDLLHRQNKTLEAMAEALFRRLFLERVGKLGQITELIEINPLRKLAKGQLAPYLEMSNVNTTVFHPVNWYLREFTSGMRFINGDTLFGRITPCLENGKAVYVTFLEKGQVGWGSTEFIVLRSKGQLHPFFTYTLVKCRDFRDYAEGCFEGSSGRQRVNVDHLSNFEIHIPEESAIKDFNVKMEAIAPKLHLNFMQIRILEKLRDTLLPKLMSGEVMVDYS
jgi:type I restriction enzyme S subunit